MDDRQFHEAELALKAKLSELQRRYKDEAQPILDRLTELYASRPLEPFMMLSDGSTIFIRRAPPSEQGAKGFDTADGRFDDPIY